MPDYPYCQVAPESNNDLAAGEEVTKKNGSSEPKPEELHLAKVGQPQTVGLETAIRIPMEKPSRTSYWPFDPLLKEPTVSSTPAWKWNRP